MNEIKGIIFDYNRTIFDPEENSLIIGVIDTLKELKRINIEMCLISMGIDQNRLDQISGFDLGKYFVEIKIVSKKTQDCFLDCSKKMSCELKDVLVVGDRVEGEIFFGNMLGMQTAWFRNGKFKDREPETCYEEPDFILQKFSDILSIVGYF